MNCQKYPNEPDRKIAAALHHAADGVEVSPFAEARLMAKIKDSKQTGADAPWKERLFMKRFSKRFIVAFCAIFCLTCMTAVATGVATGWHGHNIVGTDTNVYADVADKLLPKLEYTPNTVEEFTNGFEFAEANLGISQATDENHNDIGREYTNFNLRYKNAATGEELNLSINNIPQTAFPEDSVDPAAKNVTTHTVGDVTVVYKEYQYKFVPPDYEITAEDQTAMDRGDLVMSYGSSEVEEKYLKGVDWYADGVHYNLFGWDLTLTADDMFAMAEEIINAE